MFLYGLKNSGNDFPDNAGNVGTGKGTPADTGNSTNNNANDNAGSSSDGVIIAYLSNYNFLNNADEKKIMVVDDKSKIPFSVDDKLFFLLQKNNDLNTWYKVYFEDKALLDNIYPKLCGVGWLGWTNRVKCKALPETKTYTVIREAWY